MKLIKFIAAAALLAGTFCSCTKFDDSALWQAINKNAADIAALKETTKNLNSDLLALKQIVTALQNRDYITDCTPLADGTGYTIAFNSGKSIVIRNGKDGVSPQIGVGKFSDGLYYWTLNGNWLLNGEGKMIMAEGKDGITPQIKIEDECWYVSTDNGVTWTNFGKARGEDGKDGDSFFKNVIVGTETVTFILADGTSIILPLEGYLPFEMVDLGLPSGLKWASCNLGASKPEEFGSYYQWGGLNDVTNTSIYLDYSNCPYHEGTALDSGWTKYIPSDKASYWSGTGDPDNKTVLDPEDDIANVKSDGKLRMPTTAEFEELINNCTSEWTTINGVNGRKFTSNKNGNSIFLPAAGYRYNDYVRYADTNGCYWSTSLDTNTPFIANGLYFYSSSVYSYGNLRCCGFSVRPVSE